MALVMGVVSPYWMKSIDPSVALVRAHGTTEAANSGNTVKADPKDIALTAGGQK